MLVTITPRLRVHRDEVLCALLKGNMLHLRFASMKAMRVAVDDLTDEAREWLLPSLAPREIFLDEVAEEGEVEVEEAVEAESETETGRNLKAS